MLFERVCLSALLLLFIQQPSWQSKVMLSTMPMWVAAAVSSAAATLHAHLRSPLLFISCKCFHLQSNHPLLVRLILLDSFDLPWR